MLSNMKKKYNSPETGIRYKTASAGKYPDEFMDACILRSEIYLHCVGVGRRMRNWNGGK